LDVNKAAVEHYGYSRSEFLALTVDKLRSSNEQEAFRQRFRSYQKALEAGHFFRGHAQHHKKHGTLIDVEVVSHTITFEGKSARLLAVQDITEQRKAQRALNKNESTFRSLFQMSADAMLLADDAGAYLDANPAASALLGRPHEELLGLSPKDIAPPGNEAAIDAMWQEFLQTGQQEGEFALYRPDGTVRYVEYRAVAQILPGVHLSILPDTHGSQVLAQLRQDRATKDIPVIIISADATQSQIARLLSAGAQAYLTKPLDVGRFLATVDEVLPS
jgi:PAS domain S-box-containing protein